MILFASSILCGVAYRSGNGSWRQPLAAAAYRSAMAAATNRRTSISAAVAVSRRIHRGVTSAVAGVCKPAYSLALAYCVWRPMAYLRGMWRSVGIVSRALK